MSRLSKTAGLEGLEAGPYRWNAVTYSSFLRDAYDNVVKTEVERLHKIEMEKRKQRELTKSEVSEKGSTQNLTNVSQNFDLKIAHLVQSIVDESCQVLENQNWTDIIGQELWDILKLDELGNDRYKLDSKNDTNVALKIRSVVQLLKFIRNKISHIRTYKDDVKKLLPFFNKDNGQYNFNENNFVAFWISKFPKLVPYLWLKLYKVKNKLSNYYPDYNVDIGRLQEFLLDVDKLEKELQIALYYDMENGNVLKRFKGPSCSLEFRGTSNLVKILDKSAFIKVAVNPKDNILLSVSHSKNDDKLEYIGVKPGTEKLIIIFVDNITDIRMCKLGSSCDCRVIVFCDQDKFTNENFEQAVGKFRYQIDLTVEFSEFPIRASELSIEKRELVFENGQVCVQERNMKIKDIITNSSEMMEELSGEFLNKLLKQDKPVICANYNYPEYKGVYVNRKIYFTYANGKEKVPWLKNILTKIEAQFEKENLHELIAFAKMKHICIKCEKSSVINYRKIGVFGESEFLLKIIRENLKSVFILAESGMGKSKLLLNLGKMMKNSLVIYCPFRNFVDPLKKRVGTRICSQFDVKSVIIEILGCGDICEKNIIDKWLERKCDKGVKVELQLDGLDEVPIANLKLALRALKIVQNYFHAIRLWITSDKPLPNLKAGIKFTYCSILPLSLRGKIDFFKQACRVNDVKLAEKKIREHCFPLSLKLFLHKDLAQFLGYPLNYSMLVELYENNIFGLALIDLIGVGVELFESLYQKKFIIMYKEKKGMIQFDDEDFNMEREIYLQLHTHLALVHLFPSISDQFSPPIGMQFFTKENYHKMGIITSYEPLTFIHLKYADFFVAKYIMKVLKTGNTDGLCPPAVFKDLIRLTRKDTPRKGDPPVKTCMWRYIDDYLGKVVNWNSLKGLKIHKSLKRMYIPKRKTIRLCITRAFECNIWNLARLLIHLWIKEKDKFVCNRVLYLALISGASSDWFIKMCRKLSFDNKYKLILYSVQKGQYEIAKYLIERKCDNSVFNKISKMRKNGGGILHCIVDLVSERQSLAVSAQVLNEKFVTNSINFIRFVHGKSTVEIERKDNYGRSIVLALPIVQKSRNYISSELIFQLKEFLLNELNVDVNERSTDGESILCLRNQLKNQKCPLHPSNNFNTTSFCCESSACAYPHCKDKHDIKNVEVYHKTLVLVTSKNFAHINLKSNVSGLTPLQETVHLFGSNLQRESLECFREFGADFNEVDGKGDTILHYCVKHCDNIYFIKLLVEHGCRIDVKNGNNFCALCLAVKLGKVEIKNYFREKLGLSGEETCGLNCVV